VPTLVIWGREDKFLPSQYAARWRERVPNASVEMIPACGHLPQLERPERLVAVLDAFRARYACDN